MAGPRLFVPILLIVLREFDAMTGGKIICINLSFIEHLHPKNTSKESVKEIKLNIKSCKNSVIFFFQIIFLLLKLLRTLNKGL